MELHSYAFISFVSAIIAVVAGCMIMKHARAAGAIALSAILFSTAIWSLGYAFELSCLDFLTKRFWLRFEYLGISFLPALLVVFGISYSQNRGRRWRAVIFALTFIGLCTLILNWTTELHGLFYSDLLLKEFGDRSAIVHTKGIWYWVHISSFYVALMVMFVLVFRANWNKGMLYRHRMLAIFLSSLPPCLGNILYLTGTSPWPELDLSPILISLMGVILFRALYRYGLFNAVPIARESLFQQISDGLVVLDTDHILVEMNPMAEHILKCCRNFVLGKQYSVLGGQWSTSFEEYVRCEKTHYEMTIEELFSNMHFEIKSMPLFDSVGVNQGTLISIRDITERKQLESEREEWIETLQTALAKVQTLNGLLPICSACKKIRDDSGYWQQVDVYIHDHSSAEFSHSLCPHCLEHLYPEP